MKRLLAILFTLWSTLVWAQQSVQVPATMFSAPIAAGTQVRTTLIAGVAGKSIYVTSLLLAPVSTAAVTFSSGTGSNCATNTIALSGIMTFGGQGVSYGSGNGAILVVPSGADLCLTISTAGAPGIITYAQY